MLLHSVYLGILAENVASLSLQDSPEKIGVYPPKFVFGTFPYCTVGWVIKDKKFIGIVEHYFYGTVLHVEPDKKDYNIFWCFWDVQKWV